MIHTRLIHCVALFLVAIALAQPRSGNAAGLYRTTGPDGTVTYSDLPQPVPPETPTPDTPAPTRPPVPSREPTPKTGAATVGAATADEVLELAGVRPQLAATPARMAGEFRPRGGRLNAEDTAALEQILARHFDADRLYGQVRAEFKRRADARKLGE